MFRPMEASIDAPAAAAATVRSPESPSYLGNESRRSRRGGGEGGGKVVVGSVTAPPPLQPPPQPPQPYFEQRERQASYPRAQPASTSAVALRRRWLGLERGSGGGSRGDGGPGPYSAPPPVTTSAFSREGGFPVGEVSPSVHVCGGRGAGEGVR